jgi:hypothetical protein
MEHLETHNILADFQHGFREKRSCEAQLIITVEEISRYSALDLLSSMKHPSISKVATPLLSCFLDLMHLQNFFVILILACCSSVKCMLSVSIFK